MFLDAAEMAEFFVTPGEAFIRGEGEDFLQVAEESGPESLRHGGEVVVSAAEGFGDDVIDEAEFAKMAGGDFEGFRGAGGGGAVLPQNGGAAFGGDDGLVGFFEDEDAFGHADAESAAGAAFADDGGDDGDFEEHHFAQIDGDGLGDVAFLSADAGVGTGGIDESDDGEAEFIGHFHEAKGFAVAFGVGGTEIAADVFLGVAAFLGADEHDAVFTEAGEAADDGLIVGVKAIAVEFGKIGKGGGEIIEGVGAAGMAGELDALPWGEVRKDGLAGFLELGLHLGDLGLQADGRVLFEFIELALQFEDRLFEIQIMFHSVSRLRRTPNATKGKAV